MKPPNQGRDAPWSAAAMEGSHMMEKVIPALSCLCCISLFSCTTHFPSQDTGEEEEELSDPGLDETMDYSDDRYADPEVEGTDLDIGDEGGAENEELDIDIDDGSHIEEDLPVEDAAEDDLIEEDPTVEDAIEEDPTVEDDVADDDYELPPTLVWVSIPTGTFYMGCSLGDTQCTTFESPRHEVTVSAFEMTRTEITQAQYAWLTGLYPSFHFCPDCPVEQVSWHQAKSFCEDIGGRLPSEAEWEYAARADTETPWTCSDLSSTCLENIAWYQANSAGATQSAAGKIANGFGLYDMIGNVWEWVEDCWHADYTGAPTTGIVWPGGDCLYRVVRGGAYDTFPVDLRVSRRNYLGPGIMDANRGFRCVRSL